MPRKKTPGPKLPTTVKVGYRTYTIKLFEGHEGEQARKYGEVAHLLKQIKIDMHYGTREAASALLHELMHVVYSHFEIKDKDEEERVVSTMSVGLADLWRDNPDLFRWIAHHMERGS